MKLQQGHEKQHTSTTKAIIKNNLEMLFESFPFSMGKNACRRKLHHDPGKKSIQHFQVASCLHGSYLPKVPCARADLFFCAVVNPASVIQNILLPLLLIVQEHCVLWEDMTTCCNKAQTDSFYKSFQLVKLLIKPSTENTRV